MAKIVVFGSLNMDIVALAPRIPAGGETITGIRSFVAAGGKGANQAYAAASLGGDVQMHGCVGQDGYGSTILESLARTGCETSHVRRVEGATGLALITVGSDGQNAIVVVPGANACFDPGQVDANAHSLDGARYVLLQLEIALDTVIRAATLAKAHGATVILDPAPALSSLPFELLRHVDILTPNESEAALLLGQAVKPVSREQAVAMAVRLQQLGVPRVVLKAGAMGCVVADRGEVSVIAAPRVDAVDTTAAGDVFNGALAVALCEGRSLVGACEFAVSAAALSVTLMGAQPSAPSRETLEQFRQFSSENHGGR